MRIKDVKHEARACGDDRRTADPQVLEKVLAERESWDGRPEALVRAPRARAGASRPALPP